MLLSYNAVLRKRCLQMAVVFNTLAQVQSLFYKTKASPISVVSRSTGVPDENLTCFLEVIPGCMKLIHNVVQLGILYLEISTRCADFSDCFSYKVNGHTVQPNLSLMLLIHVCKTMTGLNIWQVKCDIIFYLPKDPSSVPAFP